MLVQRSDQRRTCHIKLAEATRRSPQRCSISRIRRPPKLDQRYFELMQDNLAHKPGGGDKKILNEPVKFDSPSKVGSKDNLAHKAGGVCVSDPGRQTHREYAITELCA
jgi:Tau and MAP protein, tubulin-binding repeat